MIKISIASLIVEIDNKYEYIEKLTLDYRCEGEADFSVSADEADFLSEEKTAADGCPRPYLESIIIHRKIAERLPEYDAFVFHGAVMATSDGAYILTAPSGTGKTTHLRLWLSEFDDVKVINGDKPIIRIIGDKPIVFGTPWRGKEGYGTNSSAPLRAITFLERGKENRTEPISVEAASLLFFRQVYMPEEQAALVKTMSVAKEVIGRVSRLRLECNMLPDAARISRAALEKLIK